MVPTQVGFKSLFYRVVLPGGAAISLSTSLHAASGIWQNTPTNANWVTAPGETNWNNGANLFPGSTSVVNNPDTATFLASGTTAININSSSLYIRNINFGVSGSTPGTYTIGSLLGNSLFLTNGGTTQLVTGSTGTGIVQTINAPVVIQTATGTSTGLYSFANSHATSSDTLVIAGGISSGTTTQATTINLSGTNTGANTISGVISNGGAAGGVAVTAFGGATTWGLSAANTYTGATTIFGSTNLTFRGANGSALNTSAFNLGAGSGGGTIRLDNSAASGGPNPNRISNSVAINSNGGSSGINFTHSAGAVSYSETVGALNLNDGHFIGSVTAAASGQSSILTFSSLNRANTLATMAFTSGNSNGTQQNTFIAGQADTAFLGGWATVTTGSFAQYNSTRGVFAVANTTLVGVAAGSSSATTSYNLAVNGTTALPTASGTYLARSLSFGNTGSISPILDLNGSTFKISSGGIANAADTGTSTINNGTITVGDSNSAPLFVTLSSASGLIMNATIADNGGPLVLVKSGGGNTLTLAGANTFTGSTYSNSGVIAVTNALALQNSVIDYNNHGGTVTFTNSASFTPSIGGISGSQNITIGNLIPTFTLGNSNGGTGTNASYSGVLGSAGTFRLVKTGPNTQTLSGANNFTGGVTINGGTLQVGGTQTATLGALGQTGSITFGGGTLKYSGTNTFDYSSRIAAGTSTGSVSIDTNGLDVTYATALTASQSGGLTKLGDGTLTLTTANAYTGDTIVSDGILLANNTTGSATGAGSVGVSSGATLGGSGTIDGAVNVSTGGFISPGNSAGNLTLNSGLALAGTYKWELGALLTSNPGTNFDIITLTAGDVNITGATLGLNLGAFAPSVDPFWQTDRTWTGILNNTGTLGTLIGTFAAIDNTSWSSLGSFTTTYTDNDVNLAWAAVPEPQPSLLVGGLGIAALFRRRRGNQQSFRS